MNHQLTLGSTNALLHSFDDRTCRLLEEVWNSLPDDARETINRYWDEVNNHWLLNGPIFALTDRPINQLGHGSTDFHGFLMRFCSQPIAGSPDNLVKDLFAHELAHVYYYASGDRQREPSDLLTFQDTHREKYANHLMTEWGYQVLPNTLPEHRP